VPVKGRHDSWVDDAQWSPTGREIAVSATVNNGVPREGGGEFLYLLDPARRGVKRVKYTPDDAGFDEWSPDGKWLIVSNDDFVYRLSPKGGRAAAVCVGPRFHADYSPDGKHFAFDREDAAGSPTLWMENIDGSAQRHVADGVSAEGVLWSPDSGTLGFTMPAADRTHSSAAVLDLSSGEVDQLTDGSCARRDGGSLRRRLVHRVLPGESTEPLGGGQERRSASQGDDARNRAARAVSARPLVSGDRGSGDREPEVPAQLSVRSS
jgi:dipeptidyl aminopeptidase/acylaminoacyl peptidase